MLLDLGLPDADGIEMLREIKEERPEVQVIILTAHDSLSNAIESIKLGAFHFIAKPYAPEELLNLIDRAIEQRARARSAKLRTEKVQLTRRLARRSASSRRCEKPLDAGNPGAHRAARADGCECAAARGKRRRQGGDGQPSTASAAAPAARW